MLGSGTVNHNRIKPAEYKNSIREQLRRDDINNLTGRSKRELVKLNLFQDKKDVRLGETFYSDHLGSEFKMWMEAEILKPDGEPSGLYFKAWYTWDGSYYDNLTFNVNFFKFETRVIEKRSAFKRKISDIKIRVILSMSEAQKLVS